MSSRFFKSSNNEPVRAGQGFLNAQFHRSMVDVMEQYSRDNDFAFDQLPADATPSEDIYVANLSWQQIEFGWPVGLGQLATAPISTSDTLSIQNFVNDTVFLSADPSSSSPFAICLEPIPVPQRWMATSSGTPDAPSSLGPWLQLGTRTTYDGSTTYSEGDTVLSSSDTYAFINSTPSSGHAPPNSTYWQLLSDKGIFTDGVTVAVGDTYAVPQIGRAALTGAVKARVNVSDTSHGWAAPSSGNYDNLVSQADDGPVKIIWAQGGTGDQWAVVILRGAASTAPTIVTDPSTGTATGSAFTFTIGTSGNDFNVSASGSTVTINLPDASTTHRGAITTSNQDLKGTKRLPGGSDSWSSVSVGGSVAATGPGFISVATLAGAGASFFAIDNGLGNSMVCVQALAISAFSPPSIGSGNAEGWLVISGESRSGNIDPRLTICGAPSTKPCYQLSVGTGGGSIFTGQWGTDSIGNVISGGLVTTIGSLSGVRTSGGNLEQQGGSSGKWYKVLAPDSF
ncbi:MAG TPA: hypothetical protein VFE62_03000 [Gemmataceae bacterium]|nr:hypothetical protein [Gemmataceae bacterium]